MKDQNTAAVRLKRFMNRENTVGHVFAFPFIFGFVCFSLIPVCISFYYALPWTGQRSTPPLLCMALIPARWAAGRLHS